jgi:tetratricopeptide (TPR) repeat protein
MNVSYVLEGSGHRDGDNVRLIVQLLDGKKDQHLWSKTYDADIEEIFSMQSEIAQMVAQEIKAVIAPEEKQLIEKIPTTDLTAYDFYLQGEDELWDHWINQDQAALNRAKEMFNKALDYDSTYAQALVGLGHVYWQSNQSIDEEYSENYMDSVLFYANKALSYDNQLASAYTLKGSCFIQRQLPEKALEEFDKALALNPNYSEVYSEKGRLYGIFLNDMVLSLLNYHKAAELTHGTKLPEALRNIGYQYIEAGFSERGMQFSEQALELDRDSTRYYSTLSSVKLINQDYEGARDLSLKAYKLDSHWVNICNLGIIYMILGEDEESLHYWQMLRDENDEIFTIFGLDKIGYTYWKIGNHEKANYYFNKAIEFGLEAIETELAEPFISWNLAAVYAVRGERNKALKYLKRFSATMFARTELFMAIADPRFNSIRNEPEFQQIVRDIEDKYQAEQKRVRKWLEENDML